MQYLNHAHMWVWFVAPSLFENPGSCPATVTFTLNSLSKPTTSQLSLNSLPQCFASIVVSHCQCTFQGSILRIMARLREQYVQTVKMYPDISTSSTSSPVITINTLITIVEGLKHKGLLCSYIIVSRQGMWFWWVWFLGRS